MTLEQQLFDLEKTLAGFHPTHYIRPKLISQIAELKVKINQFDAARAIAADPRTLEQQLITERKIKAGYSIGHYILAGGRFDTIPILEEKIKKNARLN